MQDSLKRELPLANSFSGLNDREMAKLFDIGRLGRVEASSSFHSRFSGGTSLHPLKTSTGNMNLPLVRTEQPLFHDGLSTDCKPFVKLSSGGSNGRRKRVLFL